MRLHLGVTAALAVILTGLSSNASAASPARAVDSSQSRLDAALHQEPVVVASDRPSVMGIVARNTIAGAATGAIIGGAIYLLDTPRHNAERIGYWAAGGAVVGAAVGGIQAAVDAGEGHADRASKLPGTVMVPALRLRF